MHFPDANDRLGIWWAVSALGFAVLLIIAVVRFWRGWSRARLAIVGFVASWGLLTAQNAAVRFNANIGSTLMADHVTEAIRIACCVTLWGVIVEFVLVRIAPWDGMSERRNGKERRKDWCRE